MTCAVGRPSKNDDEICEWNNNYSECCTDEPSYNCPENSKVEGCEDGVIVGEDSCGYECHQCCTDSCPAGYAYIRRAMPIPMKKLPAAQAGI